jgi:predicted peroxiredoxin
MRHGLLDTLEPLDLLGKLRATPGPVLHTIRFTIRIGRRPTMASKAVIRLATGMEDPEKVTVAFLVAVGAAENGRPTLMFLTKEAVRLAIDGVAVGVACENCPPLPELMQRYEAAGGRYYVCRSASTPRSWTTAS